MAIKGVGSLSMTEINSEFAYGTNLSAYNGKQWYKFDGTIGNFSLPIKYSDFYGKQKSAPYTYIDVKTSTDVTIARTQNIALLMVAGGGAGAAEDSGPLEGGGGGGAGGCIYTDFTVPVTAGGIIRCTIGAGGAVQGAYTSLSGTLIYQDTATGRIFNNGNDTVVQHILNGSVVWSYTLYGGGHGGRTYNRTKAVYINKGGNGGSGGGGCPYYGADLRGFATVTTPMQGNDGGYGIENVTGGGGGGWATVGYSNGGSYWGEVAPGANGGDGKTINLFGWSGSVGGGGASSGGASGGQHVGWGTGGLGGGGSTFRVYGPTTPYPYVGDYNTFGIYGVSGNNGDSNTGGGGGGTWNAFIQTGQNGRQPLLNWNAGNGGSGRTVIWYIP